MQKKANQKIRNATACQTGHLTFKSQLEKMVFLTLSSLGFNPQYEPETHELWPSFVPVTPFYDKETDIQHQKRLDSGDKVKTKVLVLKEGRIVGIRYTPDFYFKYGKLHVYIETKGFENDIFYIKKKMFRKLLDERLKNTGEHSIFFEIYSKKQLLQAIEIIKEHEQSLSEN